MSFTHNADSVECSHDSGTTYADCDTSNTVIYTVADYTSAREMKVRFTKGTASTVASFTPSTQYPGLTFLNCDLTISSDQTAANFVTQLSDGTSGDRFVACLGENVQVNSAATSAIAMNKDYIDIIGTQTNAPTLYYLNHSSDVSETHVNRLINVKVRGDAANTQYALQVSGDNSVTVLYSDLRTSGGSVIKATTFGKDPLITVESSNVYNSNGVGIRLEYAGWHEADLTVLKSTVEIASEHDAIRVNGHPSQIVTITDSVIRAPGGDFAAAMSLYDSGSVTITGSTIYSTGYDTIASTHNEAGGRATITITGTEITHDGPNDGLLWVEESTDVIIMNSVLTKGAGPGSASGNLIRNGSSTNAINDGGGNLVCAVNTGVATFSAFLSSGTHSGTFANPLPVGNCP